MQNILCLFYYILNFLAIMKLICVKNTSHLFCINLNVIFAEIFKIYIPKLPIQLQVVVY